MKPIRISIHALGGQGGGVLAGWIVDLAEAEGWTAQATSVPGVAQRTGATVYYVELAPPGPVPVMALMPSPGDVDLVLAAELMEAGRAIARGLVTPDRTVLVASSHRVFAIAEKAAMGSGIVSPAKVLEAAQGSAKRLILADLAAVAEAEGAAISAALFGALAGAGALPFPRTAFEETIRRSGKSVERSLAAFARAARGEAGETPEPAAADPHGVPALPRSLPEPAQPIARLGFERLCDYQSRFYADLYLDRLAQVARADRVLGGIEEGFALTVAAARHLALWMAYEDVIRVADLKTRPARRERVRAEARAAPGQLVHTTEYLHPRFEEICDTLPAGIGERLRRSCRARRWAGPLTGKGRFVTTSRLPGFLLLWGISRLRRYRPRTLRWRDEQARIEAWLESAVNAARTNYALGVEVLKLQRLVKGYGDTHARGRRSFGTILAALPALQDRADAPALLAELNEAALADEEGAALGRALRAIGRRTGAPIAPEPVIVHAEN